MIGGGAEGIITQAALRLTYEKSDEVDQINLEIQTYIVSFESLEIQVIRKHCYNHIFKLYFL